MQPISSVPDLYLARILADSDKATAYSVFDYSLERQHDHITPGVSIFCDNLDR